MKLKDLKSVDELLSIGRAKMACLYFVFGVLWPIAPVKNPQVDKKKKEAVLCEKIEKGKCSNSGTHDMVGFIYPLQDTAPTFTVAGDVAAMFANDRQLPQEITPSLVVHKYARKSTKSQFCRSPYIQIRETPSLIALGYTGPYNGSFEPVQCVSIKKVLPTVTKEIGRSHDIFKAGVCGSYDKSWFEDLLSPRHWLDQNHIHESMYGLSMLQKTYPHLVKQDIAIMDPYFSQDISFAYHNAPVDFKNSKWKNLFSYIDGYCSRWSSVPWANASSILIRGGVVSAVSIFFE